MEDGIVGKAGREDKLAEKLLEKLVLLSLFSTSLLPLKTSSFLLLPVLLTLTDLFIVLIKTLGR